LGHIDENHDQWRDDDEKYRDGHQECDRIFPFRERFSQFCIKRIEREREDRRPENSREERREDVKDLINNEGQDSDEEKGDELFAFHGVSPNSYQFQRI
jgi:hypothetical protein